VREDGHCFFQDVTLLTQDLVLTFQLPNTFFIGREPPMARKGSLAFFGELQSPAVETAMSDAEFILKLGDRLTAGLQQPERFELEFSTVRSSCVCHHIPPIVVLYTTLLIFVSTLSGEPHLPRRSRTHAAVVATRAAWEGSASLLAALILLLKGYRVRGTLGVSMPSSWITMHPGFPPDKVAEIMPQARSRVDGFFGTILAGQRSRSGWLASILGLLILPISLGYLLLGRLFLGKLFFASDDCTSCGLCAEHCPNQAIEMRGREGQQRPYWTYHCESCMRCMAYCPTRAIEASHLFGVGAYLLSGAIPIAALLVWLATLVPGLGFLSRIPRWVLQSVMPIITIVAAYPLFHLLLRVRWLNRFFTLATLTRRYRRYHEPETTLKDLA